MLLRVLLPLTTAAFSAPFGAGLAALLVRDLSGVLAPDAASVFAAALAPVLVPDAVLVAVAVVSLAAALLGLVAAGFFFLVGSDLAGRSSADLAVPFLLGFVQVCKLNNAGSDAPSHLDCSRKFLQH